MVYVSVSCRWYSSIIPMFLSTFKTLAFNLRSQFLKKWLLGAHKWPFGFPLFFLVSLVGRKIYRHVIFYTICRFIQIKPHSERLYQMVLGGPVWPSSGQLSSQLLDSYLLTVNFPGTPWGQKPQFMSGNRGKSSAHHQHHQFRK